MNVTELDAPEKDKREPLPTISTKFQFSKGNIIPSIIINSPG